MATDIQKLKAAVIAEVRKREKSPKLLKGFQKPVTSKRIFKKQKQPTIVIKQTEAKGIFDQKSQFFKSQLEGIDETNLFL